MDMIKLPKTGLTLSSLGMGTVPMVTRVQSGERANMVRAVMDLGINWFDTARAYIDAEEVLGEAFKGIRERVVIISKSFGGDVETLRQHLDQTLAALQTDYLDIFFFHGAGAVKKEAFLAPGGILEAAQDARQAGKLRFLGFSAHSVELALRALDVEAFDFAMIPANFISIQYIEGDFMAKARERGVTVFAMKPLGGGRLENARLCLKFLKQYPDVIPCVGVEKVSEMRENVQIWEEEAGLGPDESGEIERIRATLGTRFCRQCGYCMPCPQGIGIMGVNLMKAWTKQLSTETLVSGFGKAAEKAKDCVECRECVEKCPYDLPIPEMLKENVALYESVARG